MLARAGAARAGARGALAIAAPRHGAAAALSSARGRSPRAAPGRKPLLRAPNVRRTELWRLPRVASAYPWKWLVPAEEDIAEAGREPDASRRRSPDVATWWPTADSPDYDPDVARRAAEIRTMALEGRRERKALDEALNFLQSLNEDRGRASPSKMLAQNVYDFALFHAGRAQPEFVYGQLKRTIKRGILLNTQTYSCAMAAIVASPDEAIRNQLKTLAPGASKEELGAIAEAKFEQIVGKESLYDFKKHKLLSRLEPVEQVRMSMIGDIVNLRLSTVPELDFRPVDWLPVLHLLCRSPKTQVWDLIQFYLSSMSSSLAPDVFDELRCGLLRRQGDASRSAAYCLVRLIERVESRGENVSLPKAPTEMTPIQFASTLSFTYTSALRLVARYHPTSEIGKVTLLEMIRSIDDCAKKSHFLPLWAAEHNQLPGPSDHKNGEIHQIPLYVLRFLLHAYFEAKNDFHLHPAMRDRARQLTHAILEHPNLNVRTKDATHILHTLTAYPGNRIEIIDKLDAWFEHYPHLMENDSIVILDHVMKLIASTARQEGKRSVRFSLHGLEPGDTPVTDIERDAVYEAARKWYARLKSEVQKAYDSGDFPCNKGGQQWGFSSWRQCKLRMLQTLLCLGRWQDAEAFIESDLDGARDAEVYRAMLYFHGLYTGNRELAIEIIAEMQSNSVPIDRGTLSSFATVFLGVSDDVYIGEGFTGLGAPAEVVKECVGHILALCSQYDVALTRVLVQRLLWNTQRCGLEYEFNRIQKHAARHNTKHGRILYNPTDVETKTSVRADAGPIDAETKTSVREDASETGDATGHDPSPTSPDPKGRPL